MNAELKLNKWWSSQLHSMSYVDHIFLWVNCEASLYLYNVSSLFFPYLEKLDRT